MILWIIIGVCLLLVVIMLCFAKNKKDVLFQVGTTLLGALLGFLLAIQASNYQSEHELEQLLKSHLITTSSVIDYEIQRTEDRIDFSEKVKDGNLGFRTFILPDVLTGFISDAKLFSKLSEPLQTRLPIFFHNLKNLQIALEWKSLDSANRSQYLNILKLELEIVKKCFELEISLLSGKIDKGNHHNEFSDIIKYYNETIAKKGTLIIKNSSEQ